MGAVTANPCDALERPKVNPALARGLSAEQVRQLLAVIPDTPAGLRDRAIFVTLVPGCAQSPARAGARAGR